MHLAAKIQHFHEILLNSICPCPDIYLPLLPHLFSKPMRNSMDFKLYSPIFKNMLANNGVIGECLLAGGGPYRALFHKGMISDFERILSHLCPIHILWMTYSWFTYCMSMYYYWFIHCLFMSYSWLMHVERHIVKCVTHNSWRNINEKQNEQTNET